MAAIERLAIECLNRLSASVRIWTFDYAHIDTIPQCLVLIAFRRQSEFGLWLGLWSTNFIINSLNRLSASVRIWTVGDYMNIVYDGSPGLNRLSASVRIWTLSTRPGIINLPVFGLNRLSASVRIWTSVVCSEKTPILARVLIAFRLQSEFGPNKQEATMNLESISLNRLSASVRIWTA